MLKSCATEVLQGQDGPLAGADRQIGVAIQTSCNRHKRWSRDFGPVVKVDRLKRKRSKMKKRKNILRISRPSSG